MQNPQSNITSSSSPKPQASGPYELKSLLLLDGYRNSFYCWPGREHPTDCLLYLHGIESHAEWFTDSARAVNDLGWPVVFPERRGSGQNSQNRGHAFSYKQLLTDVFCQFQYCRDHWPNCRVHLAGVSWGGKLALAATLKSPGAFASLTMIAPGLFPLVDLSVRDKLSVLINQAIKPQTRFNVPLEDAKLFTDNPERVTFIEQDPLRLHHVTAGFFWASHQLDRLIKRKGHKLSLPVHLMLSGADRIIDTEKTRAWFDSCPAPQKHLSLFDNSAHTLEFDRDNRPFIKAFVNWLKDHSQQESDR